jgi:alpha-beta hydrolase superfamily lysophospholipase
MAGPAPLRPDAPPVAHPISRQTIAGVPVLVARPVPAPTQNAPAVLWFPGFRADAAANAAELARLAEAGCVAVGVDAVGHGARRAGDLDARIAGTAGGARAVMLELAEATAAELPALVAALASAGLGDPARLGVVGVSMGGYLVYRAVQRLGAGGAGGVRAAVALLGSPEWDVPGRPDPASPHRAPAAFRDVALLSVTAGRDASVPPEQARRFHAALAAGHPAPDRARYVELPGAEHLLGADDWARAMDETVRWLGAHL